MTCSIRFCNKSLKSVGIFFAHAWEPENPLRCINICVYIYIYMYMQMCVYIYIYTHTRLTAQVSGFICCFLMVVCMGHDFRLVQLPMLGLELVV